MKMKVDKKRILLSITTILALLQKKAEPSAVSEIILQIINIIGSIDSEQKKAFMLLKNNMETELCKLFDYLSYENCKLIVEECFSIDCIQEYLIEENEIAYLSNKLKKCIIKQAREECEKFDIDYIRNGEKFVEKAELLINRVYSIISSNEILKAFEHRIIGSETLSRVKCIEAKVELVLSQIAIPNSAYLWHMPRKQSVLLELSRLHYTADNVHLYNREKEIELLMNFCGYDTNLKKMEQISHFQWWMVTGEGGTGKSRLVYEFSKMMEIKGWTVCYPYSNRREALDKCSDSLPNDTLFIIDYTEMDLADIGEWLIQFGSNKYSDIKVRVLLIQRIAENIESLKIYRNVSERAFIYNHVFDQTKFLHIKTISDDCLKQLIMEYGNGKISNEECEALFTTLSTIDKLKRPLFALVITEAYIDKEPICEKKLLLDYLCNKIDASISGRVERGLKKEEKNLIPDLTRVVTNIFVMATMVGGMYLNTMLEYLLPDDYDYLENKCPEKGRRFLKETELFYMNSSAVLCDPIEPDIIGEYYVLKKIKYKEEMLNKAWGVPYHMSRFVTRLHQDFEDEISDIRHYLEYPTLPDYIERIAAFAFYGCYSLKGINIPRGVKQIGYRAFAECRNLKEVKMTNSVVELSPSIFEGCINMESIVLSNQITSIPKFAFYRCYKLRIINIPGTVRLIDEGAFSDCINLFSIESEKNTRLNTIGRTAFSNCVRLESINIPSGVTIIGESTFSSCVKLKKVTLGDGVEIIDECAFQECYQLQQIELPSKLKYIKELAFAQCSNLENVEFSNNTTKIAEGAFYRSANPKLISNLKKYCKGAQIEFKTLYYRKGILDYLAQSNPELYILSLNGIIALEDIGESLNEVREVCENIGFKVNPWKGMFLITDMQ